MTTNLRAGIDFDRVTVEMHAGGVLIPQQDLVGVKLKLPAELPFGPLADKEPVDIRLVAFLGAFPDPLITRTAHTRAVAGHKLLLITPLDSRCAILPGSPAPTCDAPTTCVGGACVDDAIDPATLPDYTSDWTNVGDACKAKNHGAPTVIVGEGQSDYLPSMDGDTAQVEAGPQGGHHVWVALRQKNLKQAGTITELTGTLPDLGIDVEPLTVVFSFNQDEGGYCKLYGLRFQLDQSHDITPMLGHALKITAKLTDPDGDTGIGERSVMLSSDILQP